MTLRFLGADSPGAAGRRRFYDVFPLGDNKIGILIGDVADKGASAIFMARFMR